MSRAPFLPGPLCVDWQDSIYADSCYVKDFVSPNETLQHAEHEYDREYKCDCDREDDGSCAMRLFGEEDVKAR